MAHQIYLTEGIILKKRDFGEADRLFWIYTEKFAEEIKKSAGLEKLEFNAVLEDGQEISTDGFVIKAKIER